MPTSARSACSLPIEADAAEPEPIAYPLVLWDGDCGFCARSVEWARRRDTDGVFTFVPYQRAPSPPMTPELAEACGRAVHVIRSDRSILRGGRACLYVLERVGWGRLARLLRMRPLVWVVEAVYRFVASHRTLAGRLLFHS
ncbi:MAG: DUF393 domain-containing protein [Thermoanaerobaculia bacterium]